jgi:hypothetical protein
VHLEVGSHIGCSSVLEPVYPSDKVWETIIEDEVELSEKMVVTSEKALCAQTELFLDL